MPLAFLTGGGSAIGQGIARCLVARGWTVAVTDLRLDLAQEVATIAGGAPQVEALRLDATDRAQVDALVQDLKERHGGIDALVNAAGGMRGLGIPKTDFVEMPPEIGIEPAPRRDADGTLAHAPLALDADETFAHRILPYRHAWARGGPRFHDLAVGARAVGTLRRTRAEVT